MGNKKVLSKATRELNKTKRVATPKNIIEDPRGQWAHPGEITRIPSDTITMQGVPYPVMAYPNMGEPQMMYPGQEYYFPGAEYVDEYPQMKRGGTPKSLVKMPKPSKKGLASKKFSRSLEATNRLFTEHPLFAKPKSKRRKVFDPNAQYQDGGEPFDKFKKRLMKRYPGMQGVYGPEGENLSIVKDPNYDARSAGYGDIEFTFPGDDPVINYPNLVEQGGPDYNYPNPSPDKYTALYNPRGANRGDIFLDMMHGMRDDPNYQPLLQNFEKAVRDARGEDMAYYYDDQVKKGSTQTRDRFDENYIDSQLRAQLAPGTIGMFSHGRRDYRRDRKYDSPEMRAAAEDIRNYLKGKPTEEEYQEGGMTVPLDLDPKTMKRYLADLKNQENNIKKGYRNGKWYPHASPEGGLDTIAYGHKLTSSNSPYYKGITDEQAEALLLKDVLENQALAKKQVDAKFGEGTFDSLPQDRQMLLVDYQYNLGSLKEFPKFVKAVVEGDTKTMIAEHTRYGGKDPLTRRNAWTLDVINNMVQPVPEKPSNGVTIPLANIPDATNVELLQVEGGPKEAIELELSPEEIEEYRKGGYIIEDISVPSLNKMQDGGIVQLDGYRFKKDDSGNWFYESGAPVTDRALVQRLTYESKPVGSPVVQNAPRPRVNQAVWENAAGTSQKNAIAREKQLQALKASPVRADQEKAAQIEQQRAASEAEYMNQLRQSSQYEQPLDMMDWLWGAAAIGPTIAPAAWAAAETAGTAAMPYINAAFNTIPGQLVSSGLAADAIVNRLYPSAGKIQEGKYGEAAGDIATGLLDLWGANMLSPIYKGAKATASELGRFIGTEEGLLSNTYKYNPWAFKPNPEAYYRMIGNEGYADALESGVLRSNPGKGGLQKQEFDDVYFSMKHPWDGRNYGYVTKSGEPIGGVGYTGPYMAELTGQELNHPISSFPRANMAQSKVPISLENPNLKLYKQDWLRGYKEVPKELPGSPNSSFSIFPKKPVPLQGYDLSKGQAYKTIYSNPEHNWHNQSYKDLYDQMLRDLEQQKKLSDELAGFDPLDKMNNSVVSNEAYKNLLMGEDLKWKIDDDLTTPRIPFNKSGQRAEGVRFNPRVQYKPMDPLTRAYMLHNYRYGLNNMYRTERLLPSVQTLRNLPKWTIPLDAKTFSIEMRNKIINPRTGKPITLENIERASPKQLELWKQQGIKKMQRELMDDIELQSLMPKYDPRDFNINQNKEGGMVLELTPEEIKQYQMGGYIVEDVEGTDEAAMPCPPGYIYDPKVGRCVPENAYRLNRTAEKDDINVDDALRENRRYYEGYQFMKDWQNSPMYDKMLKGAARSPESYEYMKKMRQQQLDSTPPLQILPQPKDEPNTGGYSINATGQIVILPAGFRTRGTHSHELSHSSDRPVRGKRSRLIPQRDVDYINKNKAKTIADSRAYHNYKDQYDPIFKEYPEYKQQVDDSFREFSSDYVGEPTEVRARLNAIRQLAKEANLYDPFTQGVSPDLYYKKLKNYQYEKGDKSGFDPMKQLQDTFSDEEIIWMLNNISKNQDQNTELDVAQEGGEPNSKTTFYTVEGSDGVYRKVNGKWEVDWNRSGKFQPLSKGDVKKRAAVLDKKAKPLYDATYDDLYATQRSAYTAAPKPTPAKKPTTQNKAAQEKFDKAFAVTGKSNMEVVEDKIQKGIDDYARYHQEQTGKPLTQEEYNDAYRDIYNRAYVNAGVYKPTMSGPTINPYGTTAERKNLVSLDPGKAPKNLTLDDYIDKGWDVVTNPLDYASYALRPKGTVTTPWNMTNYENRLEAAGLEDPITANNNVSKAIDFATYFTPIGAAAQGLKMIPGTAYSIGKAFEEPSWENTGDALFNTGIAALSLAPGFGAAKNLGRGVSSIDDLKAIEALRGNTATTPFQSYYLTGNRALNASEAAIPQAQALRRFTGQQPLELPAGQPEFFNSEYKKLYDELQEAINKQKAVSDELADFDPIAKINQSKVDNKTFSDLIMGDDLKFKFDDYPDTPRIPVRYAGLEQIRSKRGPISLNLAADTPGQLPPLTRTPREMKAIDDLRKLHSRTKTGQSNAEDVFNRFKSQKLKDLDTPEGRRRIQEYIDDNNITKTDYAQTNYDEVSKRYDLRDVLTNPNHEKHQIAVEGLKEELIKKGRNPSDYNLNSWDEFTGDVILSNMRLYLNADDIVAKSYPDYTPGFIERPITPDEYIDYVKTLKYSNPETDIKIQEDRIDNYRKRLSKLRAKKDELLKDYQEGNIPFDTYRRIKSAQEADIIRTEQEIMSVQMSIDWLINDLVKSNAAYNLGPNTIQIGDPLTSIGDLDRALYHEVGHATELPLLKSTDTSKVDKDLLDEVVLAEKAPAHLLQDLDLDAMSQVPPYRLSRFSLSKAQNPIAYWNQARSYFRGPEASAFVAELRPLLKEAGLIKNDFDKVTPEMVEELYQDYISRPVWETGTRIFDIIEPVDKSFKAISKALNKIKGVAPYAIPVGLGVGATSLAGQEEMQQDMEYQDGGIIMELSDDEIQEYANGGFVVEELDYKPDAGKVLNKKTVTNPKPSINTTGLAYKPNASAKVESPNPKASVQTVPKPKVPKSPPVPPPATIESMRSILDKYDVSNTSPIVTTDVFQSIIDQRNQEKQAKLQKLQRQLDASQRATHTVPEQPVIKQYEFSEEFIEGMPNVRTEQSASYLGGRPLKNEVKKIVLHHTGSTDEKNNNKYVHNHFMNPESETSAHIVIEEDGTRTIYASPDQVTFHAGKSSWDGRDNVNDFGVGVEFQGDTNVKPLTSAQIRSFVEYFDQLAKQYNVSTKDIITHAMIAPGRKPDITESEYRRILKYLTERGYK